MDKLIKSKQESFDAICYVIKALGLFFCFYPLFNVFFEYSPQDTMYVLDMRSMVTAVILLVLVLGIWLVLQPTRTMKAWRKWLEISVFYSICFASILASGGNNSNYKFLFIFMVVTYTVQYGMNYGLSIGITAAITLLGTDLVMTAPGKASQFFQSDLALSIMFIIISYILGRYVRLENEHVEELMQLANRDGLTNLYNHRYFYEAIERQWKIAEKNHESIALLMMDIDYFKIYNDICGHLEGDRVLTMISGILQANARPQDILCRYGGEEFVMLLPNTSQDEAMALAEVLRCAVMDVSVSGEEYLPNHRLTISLGVAVNESGDNGYNELVTRADNALYRAKYLRKNRVESYQNFFDRFEKMDNETRDELLSIRNLVSIVNVRDDYTYSHTERVVFCCEVVARYMGLSEEEYETLLISAYMHDVGKINVPKEVLISSRPLKDDEWELVKRHPSAAQKILSQISGMETVGTIVSQHHERYDGAGYPRGLAGDEIHHLAYILSLADSFDAMTNNRPYQKKRSFREALEEIENCGGRQFHPEYSKIFVEAIRKELQEGGMHTLEDDLSNSHKEYHGL